MILIRGHGGFQRFIALAVGAIKERKTQRPRQERHRYIGATRQFRLNGKSALRRHGLNQRCRIGVSGNVRRGVSDHVLFTFLTRLFFFCPVFVGQLADTWLNLKIVTIP